MKSPRFFIFAKTKRGRAFIVPIWKSITRSEIAVLNLAFGASESFSCHFVKFLIIIPLPLPLVRFFESFVYVLLIPLHPRPPCLTPPTSPSPSNSSMPATSQSNPSLRLAQTVCLRSNATKVRPQTLRAKPPLSSPFVDEDSSMSDDDELQDSSSNSPNPILSDWFLNSHQSSLYLAEKTCEMVCYLWFASTSPAPRRHHSAPHSSPQTTSLQFSVSPHFIQFMQKVLETTQVSQSVIVLSLHYIYRLKERNRLTNSLPGSEFRVAIAALMMANKFVDEYVCVIHPPVCSF
jgi:hypothetical protein